MEDYGFEYSDEEQEEQDVDIENQYYNSKGNIETEPEEALSGFAEVVRMEPDKAEGFKALKQTVKIYYRLGKYREMMDAYREMLTYIKSAVTRNYSEKCINSIMDFVSGSAGQNTGLLQEFYQTTLTALEEAKNERLWFKTNLKLCNIWFDIGEYRRMTKILKELHKSCQKEDGTDDQKKGSQLLEVYAIEIQIYTETKDNKKLKQLYQKALAIKSAIPHPRIMGIIRECGGKMHMAERQWAEAATDFFEAFKNYDEAGNQRRIQCLKYLVLANMLMESEVNPFDGQEAKPYKNDPEILAMTNLVAAYQRNEIIEFEKILKNNRKTIMDDPFIRNYMEDLLKKVRTQVLLKLIKPYTKIGIPFISKELNVPEKDVTELLVSLILDSRIDGHIDEINRYLLRGDSANGRKLHKAVDKWNTQLKSLSMSITNRKMVDETLTQMGKVLHDSESGQDFAVEKTFHKGPWTSAEDQLLTAYVDKHGEGNWNAVQKHSGLSRCGKSCRLRWVNHLRPSLKKGGFTDKEEQRVIELHASMGNKWARMAAQLPGRTDNEIKNFWNTRLKKLQRLGLPIYPDEVREQAMNAAVQNGQNSDHSQESLEPDCLEIPEFDFKYLQLNNYQSVLLRNVPMGSPYMSPPKRKRVREPETDFLDTGGYAANEQSGQLWNYPFVESNAAKYSSPSEKLELPSFQCCDPLGDWETQHSNPMLAVESDSTLVESPLTDCPSSGLLESVVYGSSGEKQATNSTDPDSPLLLQSSLFGHIELTPAFANNTETDMVPFGPTSSSERLTSSLESSDWIRQLLGEDRDYTK
ncbi:hypothetical protein HID58_026103 [Brassica napus]|uniref:COP9 signalosome complex subunit 2 n=1 Tax=Brassica napus TaxID=3708 RepID=A0ABQ8CPF4_BRANA|nr:hypothetical protein HID58_026103 [Brassica napus]